MGKIKVGVYVFTHQIKERKITEKDRYFDGKAYYGFNYVVSEIDMELYDIAYVSAANINTVDFALISIVSFYDVYNVRKELFGKKITCKLIFGGSGISNIQSLADTAYAICIGRGETLVNDILDGKPIENVWYKGGQDKIKIGQPKELIRYEGFEEKSVGCSNKCKFCQYGWKFKLLTPENNYNTGYANKEDIFKYLDFSSDSKNYLSALDGLTEYTRRKINKPLKDEDIAAKFSMIYDCKKNYFPVQLYNIIGFPWEKSVAIEDFFSCIKSIDRSSNKKCNILIVATHFVPMPFTPLECMEVNLYDFRDDVAKSRYNYHGKTFNVLISYKRITTPLNAIEQTIVNRIKIDQLPLFDKLLLSSKYRGLKSSDKLKVIDKYFAGIYGQKDQADICPEIERPFKYKVI
jgi:radical SAM superfamily enzyme YgiQ (UPF0313 family)